MKRKIPAMIVLLSALGFAACIQGTAQTEINGANQTVSEAATEDSSAETDSADLFAAADSSADAGLQGAFDFETHTVLLNSGYEMPIMGLGTYSLSDEECYNSVTALLETGGRLVDTAYMYGNEAAVGRAVRDSDVPREEIFVITKLYPGEQFANPEKAIQEPWISWTSAILI